MEKVKEFFKNIGAKITEVCGPVVTKIIEWFKTVKWKVVWDKVTTGILILLMASPILILLYLVIWFMSK